MINLLPKKYKKQVHREYVCRLLAVIFLVLTVAGVVGGALMLPSLFATSARADAVAVQAELIGGIDALEAQTETFEVLLDARKKIEIFDTKPIVVVNLLKDIITVTPATMSLDSFSFEDRKDGTHTLAIGGVARTRDQLVEFSRDLERIHYIHDVALPVSNLASNRNITFSITMRVEAL